MAAEINPRLIANDLRFVLLGSSGDDLKKPFERDWQNTANYRYDDPKLLGHLKHAGNYGVCGGMAVFAFLIAMTCPDGKNWVC